MEYYRQDLRNLTFKECWTLTRNWQAIVLGACKVLRIAFPIPGGYLYPPPLIESKVDEQDLPPHSLARLVEGKEDLQRLGFISPVYFVMNYFIGPQRMSAVALLDESRSSVAMMVCIRLFSTFPPTDSHSLGLLTPANDGRILVTSNDNKHFQAPPGIEGEAAHGASPERLWKRHVERMAMFSGSFKSIRSERDMLAVLEDNECRNFDFNTARGVYVPMTDEEIAVAKAATGTTEVPVEAVIDESPDGPADTPPIVPSNEVLESSVAVSRAIATDENAAANVVVLQEIARIQNRSTGLRSLILVLLVSGFLFVIAGAAWWSWGFTLMVLPVLLFHELGHYVAMRILKYRNLRILFIPLLGAAVVGRHYNVPGWKKAIVSLMGPLPGIGLGAVLGMLGLLWEQEWLVSTAVLMLVLNGVNLLPFLPLDGGWIVHAVLFSRHHFLDIAFRIVTVAALFAAYVFLDSFLLLFLAILMLIAIPHSLRLARVVRRLAHSGIASTSPDDDNISIEAATVIANEIRSESSGILHSRTIAQMTLQVFERLNTRPPGFLASVGLLGTHVASVAVALLFAVGIEVVNRGGLDSMRDVQYGPPELVYSCDHTAADYGNAPHDGSFEELNTIIATFSDATVAAGEYRRIAEALPDDGIVRLFGQSVMLALQSENEPARRHWFAEFEARAEDVFVDSPMFDSYVSFSFKAPNEALSRRIQEELDAYASGSLDLIPPWHPMHAVLEPARGPRFLARQTYQELENAPYDDPSELEDWFKSVGKAQRSGDQDAMKKLYAEQRRKSCARVRENSKHMDEVVVQLYESVSPFDVAVRPSPEALQLAQRLGRLPMAEDGTPVAGVERYSAWVDVVDRDHDVLQLRSAIFMHPIDGVEALCRWLCNLGCEEIRYGFETAD